MGLDRELNEKKNDWFADHVQRLDTNEWISTAFLH